MNILVTGANGQLGNELRIVTRKAQKDHYIFTDITDVEGLSTSRLDMTDAEAVRTMVREQNVRVIINCAAYTDVNGAESHLYLAERLNAEAPRILAEAMREVDGLLIHISTDYIFGGEIYNIPCKEDMQGLPIGVYGRTKLQGEQHIINSGCNHLIFRTSWLYSEFGHNFVKTMMQLTAEREELQVVFDQVGTPTYAFDLAQAIYNIIEDRKFDGHEGVYHYSNEGVCSWYDFTKVIAILAGNTIVDAHGNTRPKCNIHPCHSDELPSPVVRPAFSVLDKTKFKETFDLEVPYWMDSLSNCINNLTQHTHA